MEVWAIVLEVHITHDGNLETVMNCGSGNCTHLDNQTKVALQKLMYTVKLNGSLKSLE
jgi:hypothetical protein